MIMTYKSLSLLEDGNDQAICMLNSILLDEMEHSPICLFIYFIGSNGDPRELAFLFSIAFLFAE